MRHRYSTSFDFWLCIPDRKIVDAVILYGTYCSVRSDRIKKKRGKRKVRITDAVDRERSVKCGIRDRG